VKPTPENLHDFVLELLPADEQMRLASVIEKSPELLTEVAALRETLGTFGLSVSAYESASAGRQRLLSALDGGGRFSPFVAELARCFDLAESAVRALCDRIDDASAWEQSPAPGIELLHFQPGPSAIAPDTGFVRFAPGVRFPYHRHRGYEITYVLEGAMRNGDGTLYLPGESITLPPGSEHDYSIPDCGALTAVVHAGFDVVRRPT
jgi:hypothetical protein